MAHSVLSGKTSNQGLHGIIGNIPALSYVLFRTEYVVSSHSILPTFCDAFRWFALDCKGGAQTTIYVAVEEEAQSYSGEYFTTCRKYFMNPLAKDTKACEELWEESMKQCGLS